MINRIHVYKKVLKKNKNNKMMVKRYGASSRTALIESPWQIGMVERHGGVIGKIIVMIAHSSNVCGEEEVTLT